LQNNVECAKLLTWKSNLIKFAYPQMAGIPFGLSPATKINTTPSWCLLGENRMITFANAQDIHIAVHAVTKKQLNDTDALGKKTSQT
jgi:hypothetical protein